MVTEAVDSEPEGLSAFPFELYVSHNIVADGWLSSDWEYHLFIYQNLMHCENRQVNRLAVR